MRGKDKVIEALLANSGLQAIVDAASEALGNPCYVGDARFKVLAVSHGDVDDVHWRYIVAHRYCSIDLMNELLEQGVDKLVRVGRAAARVSFPSSTYSWVTRAIGTSEAGTAYFGLIESEHVLDEGEIELFEEAARIVSCEIQKSRYDLDPLRTSHEHFLLDAIGGELASRRDLETAMALSRTELTPPFTLLVARRIDGDLVPSFSRYQVENASHCDLSVLRKGELVMLLGERHTLALAERRWERISSILSESGMVCGASREFDDLLECPKRFEEARSVARLALQLEGGGCLSSLDSRVYPFAALFSGDASPASYVHPSLELLEAYDREHETELVRTLETYMRNNYNIAQTARDLFLHRNAIDYRLKRIEEIIGAKVSDPDTNMALWLSLKARHLEASS